MSSLPPRRMVELPAAEALDRLASVALGRIAFTMKALPAIRPVNHLVVDGDVMFRTEPGTVLSAAVDQVVAYEADSINEQHLGWSVIVTGLAREVLDDAEQTRFRQLLVPWVNSTKRELVVRIQPELVTGFELVAMDRHGSSIAD